MSLPRSYTSRLPSILYLWIAGKQHSLSYLSSRFSLIVTEWLTSNPILQSFCTRLLNLDWLHLHFPQLKVVVFEIFLGIPFGTHDAHLNNLFCFPVMDVTCCEFEPLWKTNKTKREANNNDNQQSNNLGNNIQPRIILETWVYKKSTIKSKNKDKESRRTNTPRLLKQFGLHWLPSRERANLQYISIISLCRWYSQEISFNNKP